MIAFRCGCGANMKVEDQSIGRKGRCPRCGLSLTVPEPNAWRPAATRMPPGWRRLALNPMPPWCLVVVLVASMAWPYRPGRDDRKVPGFGPTVWTTEFKRRVCRAWNDHYNWAVRRSTNENWSGDRFITEMGMRRRLVEEHYQLDDAEFDAIVTRDELYEMLLEDSRKPP